MRVNSDETLYLLRHCTSPVWLNPSPSPPWRRLAFPSTSSPPQLHLPASSPSSPHHSCLRDAAFLPPLYPPASAAGRWPRSSARAVKARKPLSAGLYVLAVGSSCRMWIPISLASSRTPPAALRTKWEKVQKGF